MNKDNIANTVLENIGNVRSIIRQAAEKVDRDPGDIKLVVVTKGQPLEKVRIAIEAGAHDLGENYVEEGSKKIRELGKEPDITWHMIGHIQSRKAADVVQNFNIVHSVDSVKLAKRLDRFAGESGKTIPALLECNTSGEESKFGFPVWDDRQWREFLAYVEDIVKLPNLEVLGLMVMAPLLPEAEESRPYFHRAKVLRDRLNDVVPGELFKELSMGMSSDYQIAIQEGSTIVRIGQAILGARPTKELN
jgi:pyridoxal phosphate enzyme (YggS family)